MKRISHMEALKIASQYAKKIGLPQQTMNAGDPLSQHWYDGPCHNYPRNGAELHVWHIRGDGTDISLFKYVNNVDKGFTVCLRHGVPVEIKAKDRTRGSVELDDFLQMLYG